jgi:integrase
VTIQRSLIWRRNRHDWYFSEPKTARSRRTVPLPPGIMKSLTEYKRRQAKERLAAGVDWQNLDLVFARLDGSPVRLWDLRDNFEAALKAAGLRHVRLYDLRHSCATILMAEGLHPKVVSERLGHASIALTLGVYSHVLPGMQEQATEKLEKAIFS